MTVEVKKEGKFTYIEKGEGTPIIILHGLMGGLSNFEEVVSFFSRKYKVVVPELPLFSMPLLTTSVKTLAKYIQKFIKHKKFEKVILLGNSLGGHVGLLYAKMHQYAQQNRQGGCAAFGRLCLLQCGKTAEVRATCDQLPHTEAPDASADASEKNHRQRAGSYPDDDGCVMR